MSTGSEVRTRWAATITLGLVLAAHTLLETGRDALFLANLPVEHLPWVTIAVALLAFWIARIVARRSPHTPLGRRLLLLQLLAALSIYAFWIWTAVPGPWLYYALYVWSGVVSGVVVMTFWLMLGDLFTITQGKRFFAGIAMGGSLGALGGAAAATGLSPVVGAEGLLLASATVFAASAIGPFVLLRGGAAPAEPVELPDEEERGLLGGLRELVGHPYAARVAMLVAIAGATLTLSEYLFKSVLAEEVPAEQLAIWLARIYLGLNLLSIGMLAVGVTPLLRWLGVDKSLMVLPLAIVVATALLGVHALAAIVVLKAADGTLRYSLHKTASELLYLPMDSRLRSSVKGVIELVGGSAAKAAASLLILGLVTMPEPRAWIAAALVAFAATWAIAAWRLREPYLDVFRRTLREGSIETRIDYPDMDIASLESLIRALSHRDERAVLASLDLLVERGRAELIPSLIFYHPSHEVVARSIEIFATTERDEVLDFVDRLVDHEWADVRAAIVRAISVLAPDQERLEALRHAECPSIRLSAVAGLMTNGWLDPEEADAELQTALAHPQPATRMAVANAARLRPEPIYQRILPALARDDDKEVAREAVRAMCASGSPAYTPVLIDLLDDRRIRDLVRGALLERGDAALERLGECLLAPDTPIAILRHVPRTISLFSSPAALDLLLRGLEEVESGMVRYKILRGLQMLLTGDVRLPADPGRIDRQLAQTIERTLELLQHQAALVEGQNQVPARETAGGRLLVDLVHDKCTLAAGRIFLLLSLLHPDEDFASIESGLQSDHAATRASSLELLENVLAGERRRAVVGLVSRGDPLERLREARAELADTLPGYPQALQALALQDRSDSLRAFALYHASELALSLEGAAAHEVEERERIPLKQRALGLIEHLPDALTRRASPADDPAAA